MTFLHFKPLSSSAAGIALLAFLAPDASAQYAERPDLVGSGSAAVDVSGRSVKNKRVRAVHTTDPTDRGGTAYLFQYDPFLAYQLGRNLNFREFRERDGVFGPQVGQLAGLNPDGTTAKITANNQTSCLGCHNLPNGNPGGGANFSKDSGVGRNSPHYYGAGITEMLALQIRADLMQQLDLDGNEWVSAAEASASNGALFVAPSPGTSPVDFGDPRLNSSTTGSPSLNNIFRVWYVDAQGQPVAGCDRGQRHQHRGLQLRDDGLGLGQGAGRSALNPTNRTFLWDPFNAHSGMQAHDPSTLNDPDGNGVSEPSPRRGHPVSGVAPGSRLGRESLPARLQSGRSGWGRRAE